MRKTSAALLTLALCFVLLVPSTAAARPEESYPSIATNNTVIINGEKVTLTVFKIDGANYFKLRDLGQALDFYVGYDNETKIVYISGAHGYEDEGA